MVRGFLRRRSQVEIVDGAFERGHGHRDRLACSVAVRTLHLAAGEPEFAPVGKHLRVVDAGKCLGGSRGRVRSREQQLIRGRLIAEVRVARDLRRGRRRLVAAHRRHAEAPTVVTRFRCAVGVTQLSQRRRFDRALAEVRGRFAGLHESLSHRLALSGRHAEGVVGIRRRSVARLPGAPDFAAILIPLLRRGERDELRGVEGLLLAALRDSTEAELRRVDLHLGPVVAALRLRHRLVLRGNGARALGRVHDGLDGLAGVCRLPVLELGALHVLGDLEPVRHRFAERLLNLRRVLARLRLEHGLLHLLEPGRRGFVVAVLAAEAGIGDVEGVTFGVVAGASAHGATAGLSERAQPVGGGRRLVARHCLSQR
mmetsp:Transcript_33849/g.104499  ORF Transcript_33849/g.104499 Transcript_33849/m.104499 type:complete len:370 (-) Transcript_33849:112-1221(-)